MRRLADQAYDHYSQFGEDGIIEAIFEHIGTTSETCIELGAWDGLHFSNTANLWTRGWRGLLIEAETKRYHQLLDSTRTHNCVCVNARVGTGGPDTLDAIVARTGFPMDPDFLSIDIDGDDYHLFASLDELRPRVISCEFNPTIPPHLNLVPPENSSIGCSALSLAQLATSKGYALVETTRTNAFFVLAEHLGPLEHFEKDLGVLFDREHLTYLISGYDATVMASRAPSYGVKAPLVLAANGPVYKLTASARSVVAAKMARGQPFELAMSARSVLAEKLTGIRRPKR